MRYLLVSFILIAIPALAGGYTVPQDTNILLQDALQPLDGNNRMAKFTALEYLHYRLARDAAIMRPHVGELEAIYQSPDLTGEPKSSVAAVLLVLESQLDKTELRIQALRYSREEDRPEQISTSFLLTALSNAPNTATTDNSLIALFANDLPLRWYNNYPALSSFADTVGKLLPTASQRATHLANLVRIRMKLAERFEADKEQEAKFSGSITIWDQSMDEDISALLKKFDSVICSYPPAPDKTAWRYTFITKKNMTETDAVRELACPL